MYFMGAAVFVLFSLAAQLRCGYSMETISGNFINNFHSKLKEFKNLFLRISLKILFDNSCTTFNEHFLSTRQSISM